MVGERLRGRYEVIETAALGGEGRVVKALDHQHGRTVALKIRPATVGADRETMLGEARVLLAVPPHPLLPLVREDFFEGDDYVIAMDWVDGTDLGELLTARGRPGLAPSSVLAYLADAAEALTHLHSQSPAVVHGDVKPSNLILTSGGRVKLVDFGMSSSPHGGWRRAGTPGFRAPELATAAAPSRASDVYSLAATAFALLTGTPPSVSLPTWSGVDPRQAAQLEAALRLGLAIDPARRPATPGELVELMRAGWAEALPTGVVTFCLSDIEDSTALWESNPEAMARALVRHDELIADAVQANAGQLLKSMGEGDSTVSVFHSAPQALAAATSATTALALEAWPDGITIKVRFGLHTGEAERRGADYFGPVLNLAARLRGQADGGQVFLSSVTAPLVERALRDGYALVDLGPHRLKGFGVPQRVFAVEGPGLSAPLPGTECPYRGLLAFEPDDRDLFFGRDEVLGKLLDRLAPGRLVALVGASGSGKSSLLRAGVIGATRAGAVAGIDRAMLLTPGARPQPFDGGDARTVCVVDQFEELFTLCEDRDARNAFVDSLLAAPAHVVIGVRADFYGQLTTHAGLARAVEEHQVLLGAMGDEELRRAITEPARLAGLRLESGLVDVMVRDVAGEPGALPLLSHALRATWERRDGRTLTIEAYEASGGVRSAVAQTADAFVSGLPDRDRPLLRGMFLRLTELGDGVEDTRRRVAIDELTPDTSEEDRVHAVLERLAAARLVTLSEGTAEVAHEVLIREWPTLRHWLDEDRESLRLHRRLGDAARLWDSGGREPSDLYRGTRLDAAREWASANPEALNAVERAFLSHSQQAFDDEAQRQRRTNRRLRRLLSVAAVLLVAALLAGAVALSQRQSARQAQSSAERQALVSDAARLGNQALNEPDITRSLLLAVAAVRLHDNTETRSALLTLLQRTPDLYRLIHVSTAHVTAVAASANGDLLVAADQEGVVRAFDTSTWEPVGGPVDLGAPVSLNAVAIASDDETAAVGTIESGVAQVHVVNVRNGNVRGLGSWPSVPALGPLRGVGMAFSPDGDRIAVAVATATASSPVPVGQRLLVLETATGRVQWDVDQPLAPGQHETHVAFLDADTLVTGATQGELLLVRASDGVVERRLGPGGPFAIGPDGRTAVVAENSPNPALPSAEAWIVDLSTGERRPLDPIPADAWILAFAYARDGSVLGASFEGAVRAWDLASGAITQTFAGQPSGLSLAVVDGGTAVATPSATGTIGVWDLTGEHRFAHTGQWNPPGSGCPSVPCFAISPDGAVAATSQGDGTILLVDLQTHQPIGRLPAVHGPAAGAMAFADGGRHVLTGGVEGGVSVWDLARREVARNLPYADEVWAITVSRDDTLLAVETRPEASSTARLEVRELATGEVLFSRDIPYGHGPAFFSPDGRLLAIPGCCLAASDVELVDAKTGATFRTLESEAPISSIAWSPDGTRVVAGTEAGTIVLWRLEHGTAPEAVIEATTERIDTIEVSPDGTLLIVSSVDETATLWEVESRQRVGGSFPGEQGSIPASRFAPNGDLVIANTSSSATWATSVDRWLAQACLVAGRDLTPEEWSGVLPGRPYQDVCR